MTWDVASVGTVAALLAAAISLIGVALNFWALRSKDGREAKARLAARYFVWIDDFRSRVNEVSISGNMLHGVAGDPLNKNGASLIERTLREIGYLDLMFSSDMEHPTTQQFALALHNFREQLARGQQQSKLGELNTALRVAANSVIMDREMRAKALLEGRNPT